MGDVQIADNREAHRYEARLDGNVVGYASHAQDEPGRLVILHVEVDPASEGRGIGTQLVEYVLEDARTRDLTVVPQCSFAAAVMSGRADPSTDR
jgi:predicted GNAT family acetyltransferase